MSNHDHSYKLLFSHRRMVEDLLRGFVHRDWVEQVGFSTLERVGGSYVSDDLLRGHPRLTPDHIRAALAYAAAVIGMEETIYA